MGERRVTDAAHLSSARVSRIDSVTRLSPPGVVAAAPLRALPRMRYALPIMTPERRVAVTGWRPWFAPIVVAVALIVDYTSPSELWTAALPLIFMAVLLSFRERTAALAVLLLSSWIGVPIAAGAVTAVDAARGVHRAYVVRVTNQALMPEEMACPSSTLRLTHIDIDARRPFAELEAQVSGTFAALHNAFAGVDFQRECAPPKTN